LVSFPSTHLLKSRQGAQRNQRLSLCPISPRQWITANSILETTFSFVPFSCLWFSSWHFWNAQQTKFPTDWSKPETDCVFFNYAFLRSISANSQAFCPSSSTLALFNCQFLENM
jgi:hypothetical protein